MCDLARAGRELHFTIICNSRFFYVGAFQAVAVALTIRDRDRDRNQSESEYELKRKIRAVVRDGNGEISKYLFIFGHLE